MIPTTRCGVGGFSPQCMQRFASMKVFCAFCAISNLFTSTLTVFVSTQITTLEKQFGFSSTQSGLLISAFDIGFLSFILFASFFSGRVHKPRALCISNVLAGLAAYLCSISYFASPLKYEFKLSNETSFENVSLVDGHSEDLCHTYALEGSQSSTETPQILDQCEDTSDITRVGSSTPYTVVAMAIIASGMILQGIVRSPVEPYLIDYIDTNVKQSSTAAYLGVVSSVAILGPAISYGLGGYFSQIHVTLQEVSMSSKDPRWIGAWWLGFIVFGTLSIVSGIPLMFFPNHYKKSIFRNESEKSNQTEMILTTYVKEFSKTITRLLKNKLYMSINLSGSLDLLSIAGALAFTPKYIETQFGQQRWMSSILTGVLQVIPVSAGILFGGIITSRKKFSPITCIKFLILVSLLDIISNVVNMSLGCPMPDIIGYNIHLNTNSSLCMDQCRCGNNYLPVCAETLNTNYFSPCHAGCTENFQQSYGSCSCLSSHGNMVSPNDLTVKPGLCSPDCQFLIPYTVVSLLFRLVLSCSSIPGFILLIRSVSASDKGIAVGFTSFIFTLLGWFPGPVLYGKIIDQACLLWSSECNNKGACALYDNYKFRMFIYGTSAALNVGVFGLKVVQFFLARKKTDWSIEAEKTEKEKIEEESLLTKTIPLEDKSIRKEESEDTPI